MHSTDGDSSWRLGTDRNGLDELAGLARDPRQESYFRTRQRSASAPILSKHLRKKSAQPRLSPVLKESFGRRDMRDSTIDHKHHTIGDLAGETHLVGYDHHCNSGMD